MIQGVLTDGIHTLSLWIAYEDTDIAGVVYHANYLRFAERGRSAFLSACGVYHMDLLKQCIPLAFVVTQMNIKFLKPAGLEDTIKVHSLYNEIRGAKIFIKQYISKDTRIIWEADVVVACVKEGRAIRMPKDIIEKISPHLRKVSHFSLP